ncbi:MAG: protein-L-isoaspartate(D-aspartate) O-methyltransferase [Candidatus Latescibacterota bacterium]|nr:protein-L-isoaspartate(D-aspartate) O-methyltransferase [Candidatus Latescibacterota bacterium]
MDATQARREQMVATQLRFRGITSASVLDAFAVVPRHRFVDDTLGDPYGDHPLPIGEGQTISQPYIVAYMLQTLQLTPGQHVLEIGAGCGYQSALLARLGVSVAAMEIRRGLAEAARVRLQALNVEGVDLRIGDGSQGWPEDRRFDAILVAAAARDVPPNLARQLATPGRLILPVGSWQQELVLVSKDADGMTQRTLAPVRFVPLQTP